MKGHTGPAAGVHKNNGKLDAANSGRVVGKLPPRRRRASFLFFFFFYFLYLPIPARFSSRIFPVSRISLAGLSPTHPRRLLSLSLRIVPLAAALAARLTPLE